MNICRLVVFSFEPLANSLLAPFDKLRTGFDTQGERRRCWVVKS
jgi:hypothetical protein